MIQIKHTFLFRLEGALKPVDPACLAGLQGVKPLVFRPADRTHDIVYAHSDAPANGGSGLPDAGASGWALNEAAERATQKFKCHELLVVPSVTCPPSP